MVEAEPLSKLRESMRNRRCTFELKLVTKEDVLKIITNLNNSSSTGVDFIDTETLKLVKEEITEAMTKIINLNIQTSSFADIYKHSKIMTLKKKPTLNDLDCASYTPVNLLPIPGKVVGKAIFNQLAQYFETNQLIHPNHHGGRKAHSTTTTLVQMYNTWVKQMEEGKLGGS